MMPKSDIQAVLDQYLSHLQPQRVEPLGAHGGFSGAQFWRLTCSEGMLCLRRWPPEHPDRDRLQYIHGVLQHAERLGFSEAAVPLPTRDGHSFVEYAGHFWELTPWMPGRADYSYSASDEKLKAAMQGLARFHRAAATFPTSLKTVERSPGLQQRLQRLERLMQDDCRQITAAVHDGDWPELAQRSRRLLSLFPLGAERVLPKLRSATGLIVSLQPCIRDIWHDHVFFLQDRLSGLVDFGAMRHESVAGDVARLLGSLASVGEQGSRRVSVDSARQEPRPPIQLLEAEKTWQRGLAAYQDVRPLSANELTALTAFDQSGVLLSGMNWLEWIYLDRRVFDDRQQILDRIDTILKPSYT